MSFVLIPLLVLAVAYFWTRKTNLLSVAEVFAIIAIVNVASEPFMTLLNSFMPWSGGLASLGRIQKFLCLDEVQDMRQGPADVIEQTGFATGEKKAQPSGSRPTHFAVELDLVAVTSALIGPILTEVSLRVPWGALVILLTDSVRICHSPHSIYTLLLCNLFTVSSSQRSSSRAELSNLVQCVSLFLLKLVLSHPDPRMPHPSSYPSSSYFSLFNTIISTLLDS